MNLTRRNFIKSAAILGAGVSVPVSIVSVGAEEIDRDYLAAWESLYGLPDGSMLPDHQRRDRLLQHAHNRKLNNNA